MRLLDGGSWEHFLVFVVGRPHDIEWVPELGLINSIPVDILSRCVPLCLQDLPEPCVVVLLSLESALLALTVMGKRHVQRLVIVPCLRSLVVTAYRCFNRGFDIIKVPSTI